MAILRDLDGRPDELWCRADHGPHGYLSIAAHAHADALAIEFRVGGVDVLADPGTYCYAAEPIWRAYFRSTLAHNTLEVGGVDQSVAAGPHLWTRQARAELEERRRAGWRPGGRVAGRPLRLPPPPPPGRPPPQRPAGPSGAPAGHRGPPRTAGAHDCRLAFHLGPDVACTLEDGRAVLEWRGRPRPPSATLALPDGLAWQRLEGRTDPPAGWYSPSFGVRVPAVTLLGSGRVGRGQILITVLQLDRGTTP